MVRVDIKDLKVFFENKEIIKGVSFPIEENTVTSVIGPSGCGKSTLLRSINRMNDFILGSRYEGEIVIDGENVLSENVDVFQLRKKVGMVFQKPNPFPRSIFENIAYPLRIHGLKDKKLISEIVESSLRDANLWDEVKAHLFESAFSLSGGQQQRLCIARALSVKPEVILMDEPASALDPIATLHLERLIEKLKQSYTIVIVTHNIQQAARISEYTAFLYMGELVEFSKTERLFTAPKNKKTEDYITGRFS